MTALLPTAERTAHAGVVPDVPDPEVPTKPARRRFSAAYKLAILAEYDAAAEPGAKGALLRRATAGRIGYGDAGHKNRLTLASG